MTRGTRIEKDGKFYRMRRGKLVEIPAEWVGRIPTPATIRQRLSKMTNKLRRELKGHWKGTEFADRKQNVKDEDE